MVGRDPGREVERWWLAEEGAMGVVVDIVVVVGGCCVVGELWF